ncbi:hypothetical protein [Streptomyces sp. NPDC003719]
MPRANSTPIQIHLPPGVATNLVVVVAVFGMTAAAAILGTALYGPKENSERAFRIIDRLKKEHESEKAEPSPTTRSRTRSTARGEGVQAASASQVKR